MAYSPPNGASVALEIASGYTPPIGNVIEFTGGQSFVLQINATTDAVAIDASLQHLPLFAVTMAATVDDATMEGLLSFAPPIALTINLQTEDAVSAVILQHVPEIYLSIGITTETVIPNFTIFVTPVLQRTPRAHQTLTRTDTSIRLLRRAI